ncbi:chromosome segregation protein SMC [Massiliimalia massiliensis]|uniref:chromosome segregation protein SMC n=1 Tax=Massiliimalia massiliensis TaxID=1852384 RepID=UPI000984C65A|nr:chromosome segregation protein SMC [Massiliimalia massiliensis]
MLLKSLEIQGFKSFPDKTKISFGKGLTAVVGPNGSGKSNISDAVRWVMGEQSTKNLRGAKMEDVIFTGTKARKSQGFAEVSLVIDNCDHSLGIDSDEVVITRKYYRSGESEYMINRANVRLRDVNELFMDTGLGRDGYAMVGQGRIAEIVQSKSDERREIFEEAAGISKYRYRKNEAQRKLANADENLVRLLDILSELEERVEPLRQQSEKAKRFLELAEEKKSLEISVWSQNLAHANVSLKDQSDKMLAFRLEQEEIEQQVEGIEAQIQEVYQQMQQCLVDIDELRRQKDETEQKVSAFHSQIAVCENDLHHNEENKKRIHLELEQFGQSEERLSGEIGDNQAKLEELSQSLAGLEQEISEKEQELLALTEQTDQYSESAEALNRRLNELLVEQSQNQMHILQAESRITETQQRLAGYRDMMDLKREAMQADEKELSQARSLMARLEEQTVSLQNAEGGYQMKLASRQKKLEEAQQRLASLELGIKEKRQKAKLLEDLEQNMEGFAFSVKAVLRQGKHGALNGILGTVSQIITVQEQHSTAIEIALGGMLQNIVVETEQNAKGAIHFLKQENAGRATFLPLSSVKGSRLNTSGFEQLDGFVALGSDLVQFEPRYRGVVDSLLGRIVIVEDLDTAVFIAKKNGYKFKIVTLDGQVVNAGGSMTGGSLKGRNQGILSRKSDIAKLHEEAGILQHQLTEAQNAQQALQREAGALSAQMSAIHSELLTVNEDKIRCEGEEKRLALLLEQEKEQLSAAEEEFRFAEDELEKTKKQLAAWKEQSAVIERQLLEGRQQLSAMQGEHSTANETRMELTGSLQELRLRQVEIQKDIQSLENLIRELGLRGEAAKEQQEALQGQYQAYLQQDEEIQSRIVQIKGQIQAAKEESASMDAAVSDRMEQRNKLEGMTTKLRGEERSVSVQKEKLVQEIARLEERISAVQKEYDSIINKLWEEYQLTKSEADAFAKPVGDLAAAEKQLQSLRGKIRSLGSVNVAAIEEYQEVSERYEFLSRQLKDVEKSKAELERLITELTGKMQEIFEESFHQINQHFQRIFVELFGGGRAELKLTDPDNVLESGIEIFVEPPGKIIKNLTLLSGGEQAFVAIAIYFAILKVRPAPFCILDEIEAALDDVNVTKYAEYLRLMSDHTQFIMITHRRGTMEEADVLYGVTMQEEGVSKLLQLNVQEVEQKLGKLEG